ncbi:hypothetical protein PhCBS80983_g02235 [Powellomyces hirtus]|uniref:G-patch domain-containing protein n=1 Tax=Powellomyces hirtus TaxID=109895 RepID=A0A507E949_9FUNG|nr:hypothetical protein PhCBS80983_g02235 [Powellomyces hirtus]
MSMDLAHSKSQLEELRQLLALDPDSLEVQGLVADLEGLIAMLEQSLDAATPDNTPPVSDGTPIDLPTTSGAQSSTCATFEFQDGDKCLIPFEFNSATYFLPAMILSWSKEVATVLVLNPMTHASRPCNWFLEGRCQKVNCGSSHGITVDAGHLLPTQLLDTTSIKDGSKVLAQYDGIYFRARVVATEPPDIFWVCFDGYGDDKVKLGHSDILPMMGIGIDDDYPTTSNGDHHGASDNDSGESGASEAESGTDGSGDEYADEMITFHYDDGEQMGRWEAHTKGIGARLLAKMGYQAGEGLGKNAEGRMRPVEAEILVSGKGLGCESIHIVKPKKRKRRSDDPTRPRRVKRWSSSKPHGPPVPDEPGKADVFAFLNSTVNAGRPKPPPVHMPSQTPKTVTPITQSSKSTTPPNHNIVLLDLQRQSAQLAKEIARAQEALARNAKDKKIAEGYRDRIAELQRRATVVRDKESRLKGVVDGEKQKKSMLRF